MCCAISHWAEGICRETFSNGQDLIQQRGPRCQRLGAGLGSKHNSQVFCVQGPEARNENTWWNLRALACTSHRPGVKYRLTSYEVRDLEQTSLGFGFLILKINGHEEQRGPYRESAWHSA